MGVNELHIFALKDNGITICTIKPSKNNFSGTDSINISTSRGRNINARVVARSTVLSEQFYFQSRKKPYNIRKVAKYIENLHDNEIEDDRKQEKEK